MGLEPAAADRDERLGRSSPTWLSTQARNWKSFSRRRRRRQCLALSGRTPANVTAPAELAPWTAGEDVQVRKRGLAADASGPGGAVLFTVLAVLALTGGAGCGARTLAYEQPPRPAGTAATGLAPAVSSYRVGTADILVTDPAGITPRRGSVPAHPGRRLPTMLWFPVAGPPATADTPGARPLAGSFPLVVFAHGFAVTPRYYEPLLHELVAHGYVVAAPLFPISAAGPAGAPREDDMFRQPGDITAVITTLTRLAARPVGTWSGVVDPARVAIAGHSDGAESVAAMVLYPGDRDPRVSAAVVLSGRAFPPPVPTGAPIPTLVEHGLADTTDPASRGRALFEQLSDPKAYLTEAAGSHTSAAVGSAPADRQVRASIVAFLDTVLKGRPLGLAELRQHGSTPGSTALQVTGRLLPG